MIQQMFTIMMASAKNCQLGAAATMSSLSPAASVINPSSLFRPYKSAMCPPIIAKTTKLALPRAEIKPMMVSVPLSFKT
jgi:hypothetical protein